MVCVIHSLETDTLLSLPSSLTRDTHPGDGTTPALATLHTGSGHAQHRIRVPWADFQPFSNNSHPENPQGLRRHHHQAKSSPTHASRRWGSFVLSPVWLGPVPNPRHSTTTSHLHHPAVAQTLKPAPHSTSQDSHLSLIPRPYAWALRLLDLP